MATAGDFHMAIDTLVLVGQPTLVRRLRMGVFAALDQRIATRYQLRPMDLAESAGYLRHRLALAGRTDPLFADDAVARLHKASLGLPRALDNLAGMRSSPPQPTARRSSMTPAPSVPWPRRSATDGQAVLSECCRPVITHSCHQVCRQ